DFKGEDVIDWSEAHALRFKAAMDDDFATPEAVAVLFDLAAAVNRGESGLAAQLKGLARILGLLQRASVDFLQAKVVALKGVTSSGQVGQLQVEGYQPDVTVELTP